MDMLEKDANVDVMYLDFSKAFDKVDHAILLRKIYNMGIRGKVYKWIKSFLTSRNQYVFIDGHRSKLERVISGVPQGTVLGPLLFIIYINDLWQAVTHSKLKVFADDSKLQKCVKSEEDRTKLLADLHAVVKWSTANNMMLNKSKFQLLQHGMVESLKV